MQKTRQFFLRYTDQVYQSPGEELWEDLLRTKRYMELHILLYAKHDDRSDDSPVIFYQAELPEIMLEMIHQSFSPGFFIGSAKMCCMPSLAFSVLTSFFYAYSDIYFLAPEKLFRDSAPLVEVVTLGTLQDKLTWFDKLSMVQMYGAASYSRGCLLFLQRHLAVTYELCTMIYQGMETVEEKLKSREINCQNETLVTFLNTFREDEDLEMTARLLGMHTLNQSVLFYRNLVDSTFRNPSLFREVVGASVVKAGVLRRFLYVVKHLMLWFEPGHYLTAFLTAVSHTLRLGGAVEQLLMENLDYTLDHRYPLGIETFKYWNHETRTPNVVSWLLLHAFCHSKRYGSQLCARILCDVLDKAEEAIASRIVENFGQYLMDLAHLVEVPAPGGGEISVQKVVLEAILRYGRIQHKVHGYSDVYEGNGICEESAMWS